MLPAPNHQAGELTLPLHAEDVSVSRRQVTGDTVRVSTVTRERECPIDEELVHERVEIERVPIGRSIAAAPPVREEGGTTIIPVVKETVVVERRLILTEEVRIRRVRVTEHHEESVTAREQEAVVTRTEAEPAQTQTDRRCVGTDRTEIAKE